MPFVTTSILTYITGYGYSYITTVTYRPYSSYTFDDTGTGFTSTRDASSFTTSYTTSTPTSSVPAPTSTSADNTTPAPRFPLPSQTPASVSTGAQPSNFPAGAVIGVCAGVLIVVVLILGILGWKGKLGRLKCWERRNPYVKRMKEQAQDERVAKTVAERRKTAATGAAGGVPRCEAEVDGEGGSGNRGTTSGIAVVPPQMSAVEDLPEFVRAGK